MKRIFLNWHSFLWLVLTGFFTCSAWSQPYPAAYQLENPKGGIWANMPYRLYFKDGTKIVRAPSEVEVIEHEALHGITDVNGFTSVILLDKLPEPQDVILLRRVGSGKYGITMLLKSSDASSETVNNDLEPKENNLLVNFPYRMKICNRKMHTGITDKNGLTFYYMSNKTCTASLYLRD